MKGKWKYTRAVNPRLLRDEPMRRCTLGECRAACCLHGVWLAVEERDDLLEHAALIAPHMPSTLQDPVVWFRGEESADPYAPSGRVIHSNVLPMPEHYGGTACVFLREDHRCALQVAGEVAGFHPWRFKPFYCILHPLDLDEQGRITLDETPAMLAEEGSCLRPAETLIPLTQTFEPELTHLLGELPSHNSSV